MLSPTSASWRPQTIILPHGVGSVTSHRYEPPIEAPEWLPEDDYRYARYLCDADQHLECLEHDALARQGLPLTKVAIFNTPTRKRKGLSGMSRQAGNKIKASAAVMERNYGRECLTFATFTVPPEALVSDQEGINAVNGETWGPLINRFNTALRRELERQGIEPCYVYCSEVQEGRFKRTGEVALHAHYLIRSRHHKRGRWLTGATRLRELWGNAIAATTGRPLQRLPVVDVQAVKKSVVGYLGKYLSKGGEVVKAVIEGGQEDCLPSHWWGSTRGLKAEVVRQTIRDGKDLSDWLWELCWDNQPEHFRYCFPVMIDDGNGGKLHLGFTFELNKDFYEELRGAYLES